MSTMTFLTLQQELASRLRMDTSKADELTLIKRWINQSQQEIWSRYDWPWAMDREIVQTVIDKTAGTVTVTAGSTTVTGTSTSFSSVDVGKFIQFSSTNDWYKITAQASATSLTIEKAYVSSTDLTAGTYTIRQFFYSLSSSVEKIMSVRQAISPTKLEMISFRQFDIFRPNPTSTGNPTIIIIFGYDSSNNWQFTPYPFPSAVMNLEVRFKKKSTDLSADGDTSKIPEKWHSTILLDGALYRGLEYVRTDHTDRRAEVKMAHFEDGISQMISDAEPESDYHPILDSKERPVGISTVIKFPARYDTRP